MAEKFIGAGNIAFIEGSIFSEFNSKHSFQIYSENMRYQQSILFVTLDCRMDTMYIFFAQFDCSGDTHTLHTFHF
jgi:hypothetical protein